MTEYPVQDTDPDPDGGKLTPAMRQYREMKAKHPDAILFFRIGDFYETFDTDAELVSKELEIVLTSRSKNAENRTPLAGVPYHAAEGYIAKLISRGYRVAICDQVEDAKNAKGIVKRDIVRVVTPGTVIDPAMLPSSAASYLASLCPGPGTAVYGLAFLDISTGEFFTGQYDCSEGFSEILSEVARYRPAECIVPSMVPPVLSGAFKERGIAITLFRDEAFTEKTAQEKLLSHFRAASLAGFGCDSMTMATGAAGAVLAYALETQKSDLPHVTGLATRVPGRSMTLDAITLRNLEIQESIRGDGKGPTLVSCLDITGTPMGSRLLHKKMVRPSTSIHEINSCLDSVEYFAARTPTRLALRSALSGCADIERIAARIAYGNAGPRDLAALAASLALFPEIHAALTLCDPDAPAGIAAAHADLPEKPAIISLIRSALVDDPPVTPRNGGVIRPGYSAELDDTRGILHSGKDWIAQLQQHERERTGIRSLKIGYNRIFGYYIDVTKPNVHLVPSHYERKQTTAIGERYTTSHLREKEVQISHADERTLSLERELYASLITSLRPAIPALQSAANAVAYLDVVAAFAEAAKIKNYTRPVLNTGDNILIRDGRHPVVEDGVSGGFVPNDTDLSGSGTQIMIITGANMAGKSTYMRAVALICIMAQAGSFVPAQHATIGIIDRVFTRVGAFDDLTGGQSTFFVEMLELANILNNVTPQSLVILDEIGRGTSTVDGCAIAKAVLEHLHGKTTSGPKTLFATHFHDLIGMDEVLKRVKNYHFAVKETTKEVVFLRRLIPGATDKSYGIHVARLAGMPGKVTARAEEIRAGLLNRDVPAGSRPQRYTQILLVDDKADSEHPDQHPVLDELESLNPDELTPIQALAKIAELKKQFGKKEGV